MDTHLATTLKRKTTQILDQVNETREPVLITQFGQPTAYIIDAKTFIQTQQKIAILEKVARGEKAIKEKRIVSHSAAQKILQKWLD